MPASAAGVGFSAGVRGVTRVTGRGDGPAVVCGMTSTRWTVAGLGSVRMPPLLRLLQVASVLVLVTAAQIAVRPDEEATQHHSADTVPVAVLYGEWAQTTDNSRVAAPPAGDMI